MVMLVTASLPAFAQSVDSQSGGVDHPMFSRFADSPIVNYSVEKEVIYRLVMGSMRRIAGRVVAENEQRLRGVLTRITYEVPQGLSLTDAVEFYQDQAEQRGYTLLYSCSGRECGNSNYWANDVFDDRSLYGPERGQSYFVWRADNEDGGTVYIVLYTVTRTNRRQFAHIEIVETGQATAPVGAEISSQNLLAAGAVTLQGLAFDAQDALIEVAGIEAVVRLLRDNPAVAVYVVSHLSGSDDLETLMSRSQRRAEVIRERLIQQGIAAERLIARGVGPLAPLCQVDDCEERLELVLR